MLLYYATCIPEICSSASLLLLPTAPLCCSSATAVLHKYNWSGYVITRVRLHFCTLPVLLFKLLLKPLLWLGLAWVEEFKLSLSLELVSLGYLEQVSIKKCSKLSSFTSCSYISPLIEEIVEKSSRNDYQNYH